MDRHSLYAGDLAGRAGISPSLASAHLSRLLKRQNSRATSPLSCEAGDKSQMQLTSTSIRHLKLDRWDDWT
jgi:hypothetical protein